MAAETPVSPSHQEAASPDDAYLRISRQTAGQILVAIVFFGLGFIAALLITRLSADSARATYQTAIDDAVAAVLGALPEQPAVAAAAPVVEEPDPNQRYEASADSDPALGPVDAPILMIEFSDFRCPYCARFAANTFEPLMAQYEGRLRFVYRDFPVLGDLSFQAAEAAECANEQDAFWAYHDLLFANQQSLGPDSFVSLAGEIDLDVDTFSACLNDGKYRQEVQADFEAARDLGVSGTPAFFVNGRLISGAQPLQVFQNMIDEELAALEAEG